MGITQKAANQGAVKVPPDTATLLRRFGFDPDNQSTFFIYQGRNITLGEFCAKSIEEQVEILTKGTAFSA